jgi:hypothetical protein
MNESHKLQSIFKTRNILLGCILWITISLLFFLLFSAKVPDANGVEARPHWYLIGTYILEAVAYLGASILCLRNWFSSQLVGNRNIWLSIGLGMFSYCIGGIIFDYMEIYSQESPDVSVSDVFFVISYILLGLGLILAILSSRINLSRLQWLIIIAIGLGGSLLSWSIYQLTPDDDVTPLALSLDYFYVVSDVFLLIAATTLLLTFWGGKISLSWRMIAAAAFSLYIADTWYSYAKATQGDSYQSGELLEIFWIFSGVLFAIGAALEYDISLSRKRRTSSRK